MTEKTVQDLSFKEILEDLDYWVYQAQMRSPPFVDEIFDIIKKYLKEINDRGSIP